MAAFVVVVGVVALVVADVDGVVVVVDDDVVADVFVVAEDWGEYGSTFSFMWSSLEWDVVMQASASTAHPVAGLASPVIPFSQTAISPRTPRGHSPG